MCVFFCVYIIFFNLIVVYLLGLVVNNENRFCVFMNIFRIIGFLSGKVLSVDEWKLNIVLWGVELLDFGVDYWIFEWFLNCWVIFYF